MGAIASGSILRAALARPAFSSPNIRRMGASEVDIVGPVSREPFPSTSPATGQPVAFVAANNSPGLACHGTLQATGLWKPSFAVCPSFPITQKDQVDRVNAGRRQFSGSGDRRRGCLRQKVFSARTRPAPAFCASANAGALAARVDPGSDRADPSLASTRRRSHGSNAISVCASRSKPRAQGFDSSETMKHGFFRTPRSQATKRPLTMRASKSRPLVSARMRPGIRCFISYFLRNPLAPFDGPSSSRPASGHCLPAALEESGGIAVTIPGVDSGRSKPMGGGFFQAASETSARAHERTNWPPPQHHQQSYRRATG